MTRIDESTPEGNQEVLTALRRLERQPTKVVHHRPLFGGCGCCSGTLLVGLILTIFVLTIVARSGLADIPIVSAVAYRPATPIRTVTPATTTPTTPARLADGRYQLIMTEGELTAMMQETVTAMNTTNQLFTFDRGQMVVTDAGIEIFITMHRPPTGSITAVLVPIVIDHQLQFQLQEIQLGALTIPRWAGGSRIEELLNAQVAQALMAIPFDVDGVVMQAGVLQVLVSPATSVSTP